MYGKKRPARLSPELLTAYARRIEIWFEKNKHEFDSSDNIGRIYVCNVWNKKDRPQRIYIMQNFLGTRRKIGYYRLPHHYFVLESEIQLAYKTKEKLIDLAIFS